MEATGYKLASIPARSDTCRNEIVGLRTVGLYSEQITDEIEASSPKICGKLEKLGSL
jgi:hypothetical protein